MATVTIHVTEYDGTNVPDALVRLYSDSPNGYVAAGDVNGVRTDASGNAVFTVPNGDYYVHVDPVSQKYLPQWRGAGGGAIENARPITVSANATFEVVLQLPLDPAEAEQRPLPLFWKDTVTSQVLVLYPGDERRAFSDPDASYYQHALVGPFLTSAKAAAA